MTQNAKLFGCARGSILSGVNTGVRVNTVVHASSHPANKSSPFGPVLVASARCARVFGAM